MLELEAQGMAECRQIHPRYRDSARNLLHYLALRRHDISALQSRLSALGLSSLGRSEACVLASIEAVVSTLHAMADRSRPSELACPPAIQFYDGPVVLARHTEELFGPEPQSRRVRIMVTMPSEAAHEYAVVHDLLANGMNCMRINCAHDDATAWERMIQNLRRAEASLNKKCRILMDLAGPKLRTGPIEPGQGVIKWRPRRDEFGRVLAPARVWLTAEEHPHAPPMAADASLPVAADWLSYVKSGSQIDFSDARGAKRKLHVVDATDAGYWAECERTAYVTAGTVMRGGDRDDTCKIGDLPPREEAITLQPGDTLILTREMTPGRPAVYDSNDRLLTPARISCTLPEIFADIRAGERVWLDDGRIGGIVNAVESDQIELQITQTRARGDRLRADKGINLPDSNLHVPSLTAKDLENLPFIATQADIVGFSFVRSPADVLDLESRLAALKASHVGIVLKIETRQAFENLPSLLLASMRSPCDGVMIARGDLAVECGFERLAEVQEEILWICEAAHVPVIWATQVLEQLAKKGLASRAEITDVALGQRAECVMLNKGPHIIAAVQALDDILSRMAGHQTKKRPILRPLQLARSFSAAGLSTDFAIDHKDELQQH